MSERSERTSKPTCGFRHLGDRLVHQGHIWHVVVASFEDPEGERFARDIVRSPGAVAAVPIVYGEDDQHHRDPSVVLVSQYRPAFDRAILEIPAGMRDVEGEPAMETARRELVEEVGLQAGRLEPLTVILPNAGMTDSETAIFLATECQPVERDLHGPEERDSEVHTMPLRDALALVVTGRITDAKSVAGILLAERRLAQG